MFDFSFGELALIGTVALVVLGPERLPRVARTVGEWAGKAQRYVAQVKSDISREVELADLKKLQDEAREVARSIETTVQGNMASFQAGIDSTVKSLNTGFDDPAAANASTPTDHSWEGTGQTWSNHRFERRFKPGPTVYELAQEIERLKRQLAVPDTSGSLRHKRAPRARVNKTRIRR
ncbi:MAG: Sec-independent protein translocase protein TatB [Pseudomonadota bacterium]|nr:Sec-independent protein translocase protein TatB [Pseudomonadota bacterium]